MYSKYQIIKVLENFFRSMNYFSWIKLILFLIHLKCWYYNSQYAELPYLSHHLCPIFFSQLNALQHTSYRVLHRFQYFVPPHSTTSHHKYWIYQIIYKSKLIKLVIKLYVDHDTLWVEQGIHQKAESLRTASPSSLDNMVNNSSNLISKYAEFSTKC